MKYLLDTNACIAFLNGTSQRLADKLLACGELVTRNISEFRRVEGLLVEDWQ